MYDENSEFEEFDESVTSAEFQRMAPAKIIGMQIQRSSKKALGKKDKYNKLGENKKLQEGRTIKSGNDAVSLLQSGKFAGRLGGKKFVPEWIVTDPDSFSQIVNLTLSLLSNDPNIASDELIQFLAKASKESEDKWLKAIEKTPDTLQELSKAFSAQWFTKSPEWQDYLQELIKATDFKEDDWRELEKDIQDEFAKRAAKKGKKIDNVSGLYTTLYEDSHWKLYIPKTFEGDVELAKHIIPFKVDGKVYNKTRWCTAAEKNYFDRYTNKGNNALYVVQYWNKEGYKEAWQVAFYTKNHIEFMDKADKPKYQTFLDYAPEGLLEKIVCDNAESTLFGRNLNEIWKLIRSTVSAGSRQSVDTIFKLSISDLQKNLHCFKKVGDLVLTKDGRNLVAAKKAIMYADSVFEVPEGVEGISETAIRTISTYKTLILPSTIKKIAKPSYSGCKIQHVVIKEGAKIINTGLFENWHTLRSVQLPSTIKAIGPDAFNNCTDLSSINFPEGLAQICSNAFISTAIGSAMLPDSLVKLEKSAFKNCASLVQVRLPPKIKAIPETCFADCSSLENLEMSTNVQVVDHYAFADCSSLFDVTYYDNFKDPFTSTQYLPGAFNSTPYEEVLKAAGIDVAC